MSRRVAAWLRLAAAAVAFAAAFYLRMDAAYGPLNLSLDPSDWTVLWELFRFGQIAGRVVLEAAALGAAAALAVWWALRRAARDRRP